MELQRVSKRGSATKVRDLYTEYKADFVGLQETLKNKYSDKFFRLIDPHHGFAWHWLPSIGRSGGIVFRGRLLGIKHAMAASRACACVSRLCVWAPAGKLRRGPASGAQEVSAPPPCVV
jgi:hypothetical protein